MQSTAPNVDLYMETVPVERVEALTALRSLCLKTLEGYEEDMEYGMPCYKKDGVVKLAFANQKQHISLYIGQPAIDSTREELDKPGISLGKGCIRYRNTKKVDLGLVERMLRMTVESETAAC